MTKDQLIKAGEAIDAIAEDYSHGKPGTRDFIRVACEAVDRPVPDHDEYEAHEEAVDQALSWGIAATGFDTACVIFGILDAYFGYWER